MRLKHPGFQNVKNNTLSYFSGCVTDNFQWLSK